MCIGDLKQIRKDHLRRCKTKRLPSTNWMSVFKAGAKKVFQPK